MVKGQPLKGRVRTHLLRVHVRGLDVEPGINPVAGYLDVVKWDKPAWVTQVTIMPGIPDNAMDMIAGVALAKVDTPGSNLDVVNAPGLVAVTGSAIPPVVPVTVTFLEPFPALIATLVVYQSNASYSKTGVVLAILNVVEQAPPLYKV